MFNHLFDPKDIPQELRDCFEEVETECGAPWARVVERTTATPGQQPGYFRDCGVRNDGERAGGFTDHTSTTLGWRPSCACDAGEPVPATVLDCFGGSGTTGLVADQLGRDAVLIELSPEYAAMAERRINGARARRLIGDAPRAEPVPGQLDLLA